MNGGCVRPRGTAGLPLTCVLTAARCGLPPAVGGRPGEPLGVLQKAKQVAGSAPIPPEGRLTRANRLRRLPFRAMFATAPPFLRAASSAVLVATLALLAAPCWARVGLTTTLPDVDLGEVRAGEVVDVAARAGVPFRVTNRGDAAVEVVFEVAGSSGAALPDPGWVSFSTASVRLEPGESRDIGVTLRAPPSRSLRGRSFSVILRARIAGEVMGVAVQSKVRFKVAKKGGRR